MTIETELAHILKGNRDHVDEQFQKNLKLIIDRAAHIALINRAFSVPTKERTQVCSTIFWAYYRMVYFASGDYGGTIIVFQDAETLKWLAHMFAAFLGLRDVEAKFLDAAKACPAMRDNKEAAGYSKCRIITGVPFEGMMSWDITNIMACCDLKESIVLTTKHPSVWDVRATQKGDVIRLETQMPEVFDLKAALDRIRKP
jgi:hypothetical protein